MPNVKSHHHRSRLATVSVATAILSLLLTGCGGDSPAPAAEPDPEPTPTEAAIQYDGEPADLTADQVCDLLDDAMLESALGSAVRDERAGSRHPDCSWTYNLPSGTITVLQVQVMSMSQTWGKLGTEALADVLEWAPTDTEIIEYPTVDAPHGGYEFASSTVVFVVDPVGRVFSVAAHTDTPEPGRVAIVNAVLEALTERHS